MICPKCKFEQTDINKECSRCGIIFEKYLKFQTVSDQVKIKEPESAVNKSNLIQELFFYVQSEVNSFTFGGRIVAFIVIFIWGWQLIISTVESNAAGESFLHLINLPFHEAGHIFFRPFGQVITSLGGTLGQLIMPLICLFVFIIKTRDTFGASISLWWFGENFMDIAPYINDARDLKLMLLGGNTGESSPYGFHDWEFILTELGLLRYDKIIANIAYKFGTTLMLISFVWAGYLLFKQYKILNQKDNIK